MTTEAYRRIDKKSDRERSEEFLDVCLRDLRSDSAIIVFGDGESKATHPLVREGFRLMGLPFTSDIDGQAGAVEYVARVFLGQRGIMDVQVSVRTLDEKNGSKLKIVKFVEGK